MIEMIEMIENYCFFQKLFFLMAKKHFVTSSVAEREPEEAGANFLLFP
jgi:hypothetical protein